MTLTHSTPALMPLTIELLSVKSCWELYPSRNWSSRSCGKSSKAPGLYSIPARVLWASAMELALVLHTLFYNFTGPQQFPPSRKHPLMYRGEINPALGITIGGSCGHLNDHWMPAKAGVEDHHSTCQSTAGPPTVFLGPRVEPRVL